MKCDNNLRTTSGATGAPVLGIGSSPTLRAARRRSGHAVRFGKRPYFAGRMAPQGRAPEPGVGNSIVVSRSFGERITEYDAMRQSVGAYAERIAEKLSEDSQFCHHISVFIRTSPSDAGQPGIR